MKVLIIQHDIVWASPTTNTAHLDDIMSVMPKADVYVLPEMFATGFATCPQGIAETGGGHSLQWMVDKAHQLDAAIVGSLAVEEQGHYFNRLYFVQPDGTITHYDKRHLFGYGGEKRSYSSGEHRVVVSFRGVRYMMQVCYDLRFPVFSRNHRDYDAAIYVANWPTSRISVWDTLLRARAIENQSYVIGVNRVGCDAACQYNGHSAIIDAYGRTMSQCTDGAEGWALAELDMEQLTHFRQKFPVLDDAD